ncbi:MAG: glycoside hydrolase [Gemmatimonadetes bacterium]|nr:MAG: glycoside hydrolase [Gemmatimonadota bacterium]
MLKKQFLKTKCKVTFKLSPEDTNATSVSVVGTFNEWDPSANPMKALKSGGFSKTITLDKDAEYEYRYVDQDGNWFNDPKPDGTTPNEHGGENCVVRTYDV